MLLHFDGPFQWATSDPARSMFEAPQTRSSGIYLWTAQCADGYLVSYVGETGRGFGTRMREHLFNQLSGQYTIRDPEAFCSGTKVLVWRGMFGKSAEPGGLVEYVRKMPELMSALVGFIHAVHFHLAPTDCDARLRRRMEAALAASLRAQGGRVATFLDDVRYEPRIPQEEPVLVSCTAAAAIHGLPAQFEA